MHVIEIIKDLDTQLFLAINGLHSSYFDNFMWVVSAKLTWIPLYLSVLYLLIRTFKKDSIWIILSVILCIVISDQVASGLFKELVKRLRPSHVDNLKAVIHLVKGYDGGLYGFASSHAANSAGLAVITSLIFRNRLYTFSMLAWALLVSYSRIYLGVHYPGDILGGMAIGVMAALFCFFILNSLRLQVLKKQNYSADNTQKFVPIIVLSLSLIGMVVYSFVG